MPQKYIQQQMPQIGVGAVVFKDDAILLIKRRHAPNKDQWAIPGGKVQFSEPLKVAVAREILEETGIIIDVQEPVYTFEVIVAADEETSQSALHYVVIDFNAKYQSGEIQAADDAKAAAWVGRENFTQLDINQETRTLLLNKFSFP